MRDIDACLYVRPSDRTTLERLVADGKTAQKIVARARIVLLSGCGLGTNSIQREARVSKPTVWRWQKLGYLQITYRRGTLPEATAKKSRAQKVFLAPQSSASRKRPHHRGSRCAKE